MEIEYKFLVKNCPNLKDYPSRQISQAYISSNPVIRLRQMEQAYFLTVKSSGHIAREEFELSLTKEQYDLLLLKAEDFPIKKERYYIPLAAGLTAELDVYHGHLEGLYTVEVEFASMEDAKAFVAPDWFGEDISLDSRYKNNILAKYGIPK